MDPNPICVCVCHPVWLPVPECEGLYVTLTSAGPALLGRRVAGQRGLPVRLGGPTPPAVLRRSLLEPGPLLPVLRAEPAAPPPRPVLGTGPPPTPRLLPLALGGALPGHVRLPLALALGSHRPSAPSSSSSSPPHPPPPPPPGSLRSHPTVTLNIKKGFWESIYIFGGNSSRCDGVLNPQLSYVILETKVE